MNKLITNCSNIFKYSKNINYLYNCFYNYNDNDWKQYIITNPNNYEKEIIYKNSDFELVLISWNKNSITKYHSHPSNGCILKVMDGYLIETKNFDNSQNDKLSNYRYNKILLPDTISISNNNDKHRIKTYKQSYSLHLYSPPGFY